MDANRVPGRLNGRDRCMVAGSKSFAFGNAFLMLASLVFSIYLMAITFGPAQSERTRYVDPTPEAKNHGDLFYPVLTTVCFSISLIGFVFAMILYYGIRKKRIVFLKAYIIFGFIVLILTMIGVIAFTIWLWNDDWELLMRIPPFITAICLIYAVILWMVHRTAGLFASSERYDPTAREEVKLVERYDQN